MSRVRGGVDADGMPVAWQQTIVSQGVLRGGWTDAFIPKGQAFDQSSVEGASDMPYDIPNILVDTHEGTSTVPVLWWRSVGHSHTGFTVNCALDELAVLGGQDPVEIAPQVVRPAIRATSRCSTRWPRSANWAGGAPAGRGRGVAMHESFGSIVAEVAEVSVEGGNVRVHKVWCAIDCGFAVNPERRHHADGKRHQLRTDRRVIRRDHLRQRQGGAEQLPRLPDPAHQRGAGDLRDHREFGDEPMGGAGEPGTPPIAPAVANAIYAATGKRVRKLPISKNLA